MEPSVTAINQELQGRIKAALGRLTKGKTESADDLDPEQVAEVEVAV